MTNPDYTAIAVVVDRSGSMATIQAEAEGALNSFIESQAKLPGKATIRLDQFDNFYESVYKSTPLDQAPKYSLEPRGMTALLDAMGRTINDFGAELAAMPEDERPGKVMVIVVTDGLENASQEFSQRHIKKLVDEQTTKYNWDFVFLAANQDAVLTGAGLGFQRDKSITFAATPEGVHASSIVLDSYATSYRSTGNAGFTDSDRKAASGN